MKKLAVFCVAVFGVCSGALQPVPAAALSLDFLPASPTIAVGQPITVDVVISGLGVAGPPSVGAFDLDVSFDATILSIVDVAFGPFLGDPDLFEALPPDVVSSPGMVNFAEVSLLSPAELDALQPSNFALAVLHFDTMGMGTSPLTISQFDVIDAFGVELTLDAGSGSIRAVPEPATLLLLGAGLAGILGFRRKSKWKTINLNSSCL